MKIGDTVKVAGSDKPDTIDAKVSDARGDLYRTARGDAWYDTRYLRSA